MIEIDGSIGEGGGQVLRTALSLSCILGIGVRISKIRAGRENPGLRPQHLAVVNLLSQISSAKVKGGVIGSSLLDFEPGPLVGGDFKFDIGTAGSVSLLAQAALPVLAHAKGKCSLELIGGTHVKGAPTFEYLSNVFIPAASKFGLKASSALICPGFYPKGGGCIRIDCGPSQFAGAEIKRGQVKKAKFTILSSCLPSHVAEREKQEAEKSLIAAGFEPAGLVSQADASCPGNAVTVFGGMFGGSSIGERGKKAEAVAREACGSFISEAKSGASVDSHLADQLIIYAALAKGKSAFSTSKITSHLSTNADVLRAMTKRNIILGSNGAIEVL
jgi:RNA 3'-terminal phosphate cyclase (ATP)